MMMKTRTSELIILLLLLPSLSFAQEETEHNKWYHKLGDWVSGHPWEYEESLPVTHTKILLQGGKYGMIDEYLSPISHFGLWTSATAITDFAPRKGRSWHMYQEVMLSFAMPKNNANGAKMQVLRGEYSLGPSWRVVRHKGLTLDLAPLFNFQLQGSYKSSNSNNYGNAKFTTGLDGWARLRYNIPWKVSKMAVSYSVQLSLLHATFHPGFGQSYYEYISGESSLPLKFHLTSLHNNFTLRQRLLIDIPIKNLTMTLGAEYYHQRQKLSETLYVQGYWGVIFGFSFDTFSISGGRSVSSESISSSIYY